MGAATPAGGFALSSWDAPRDPSRSAQMEAHKDISRNSRGVLMIKIGNKMLKLRDAKRSSMSPTKALGNRARASTAPRHKATDFKATIPELKGIFRIAEKDCLRKSKGG